MSAITIAALSHGLFVSGSFTPPSAYDVRFGVDNGAGSLGTLTSPSVGDVRLGVEYGGGGDQYTGTLVVSCPVPTIPTTWTDDMGDTFNDLVAEFGDETLYFNSLHISCVKTNLDISYETEVSGSNKLATTAIDVKRADAISIGLYLPAYVNNPPVKRPVVTVNQVQFQVLQWKDDIAADPTIKMICAKLQ